MLTSLAAPRHAFDTKLRNGVRELDHAVKTIKRLVAVLQNSVGVLGLFVNVLPPPSMAATAAHKQIIEHILAFADHLPKLVLEARTYLASRHQQQPKMAYALYGYGGIGVDSNHSPPLSFVAGQQIQVDTFADGDGWAHGSVDGREGWFPINLVIIIDAEGPAGSSSLPPTGMSTQKLAALVREISSHFAQLVVQADAVLNNVLSSTALVEQTRTLTPAQRVQRVSDLVESTVAVLNQADVSVVDGPSRVLINHLVSLLPYILEIVAITDAAIITAQSGINPTKLVGSRTLSRRTSSAGGEAQRSSSDMQRSSSSLDTTSGGDYNDGDQTGTEEDSIFGQLGQELCMMFTLVQLLMSSTSTGGEREDRAEFLRSSQEIKQLARQFVTLIQEANTSIAVAPTRSIGAAQRINPQVVAVTQSAPITLSVPLGQALSSIANPGPPSPSSLFTSRTLERRPKRPTSPWESNESEAPLSPVPSVPPAAIRPSSNSFAAAGVVASRPLSNATSSQPPPTSPRSVTPVQPVSPAGRNASSTAVPAAITSTTSATQKRPDFSAATQAVVRQLSYLVKLLTQEGQKEHYLTTVEIIARMVGELLTSISESVATFDEVMSDDTKRTKQYHANNLQKSMLSLTVATRIACGVWPPDDAPEQVHNATLEVAKCIKAQLVVVEQIFDSADEYRSRLTEIAQARMARDREYWQEYLLFERVDRERIALHKQQRKQSTMATSEASVPSATTAPTASTTGGLQVLLRDLTKDLTRASQFKLGLNSVGQTLMRRVGRHSDYETPVLHQPTRTEMGAKMFQVNDIIQDKIKALVEDTTDLVFDTEKTREGFPVIKAGSLLRLVERLTYFYPDEEFEATFLLTYENFTDAKVLLQLLIQRFDFQMSDLTPQQYTHFRNEILKPIRLRVFHVIRLWIERFFDSLDRETAWSIWDMLKQFADTKMREHMVPMSDELNRLLVKKRSQWESNMVRSPSDSIADMSASWAPVPFDSELPPPPILPKTSADGSNVYQIEELDPLEIARQLTLIEHRIFLEIRTSEWLKQGWNKKDGDMRAPNIRRLIKRFNDVTRWVFFEISRGISPRHRAKIMKLFIYTANQCRSLNNFNAVNAILSGLQSAPVHRLRKSWELVSSKAMAVYSELAEVMSPEDNFNNLRLSLYSVDPPCVPWLGLYLRDLTFIDDGNPTKLKDTDLVNFDKCRKLASTITEIEFFKSKRYALQDVPEIVSILLDNEGHVTDEKEQFAISLRLEPKEAATSST